MMKLKFNLVPLQLRLLLLTVLIVLAGLSLASPNSNTSLFSEETTQGRVNELHETNGGSEPPLENLAIANALVLSLLLACANDFVFKYTRPENVVVSRRFLNQIRSRSPPNH